MQHRLHRVIDHVGEIADGGQGQVDVVDLVVRCFVEAVINQFNAAGLHRDVVQ